MEQVWRAPPQTLLVLDSLCCFNVRRSFFSLYFWAFRLSLIITFSGYYHTVDQDGHSSRDGTWSQELVKAMEGFCLPAHSASPPDSPPLQKVGSNPGGFTLTISGRLLLHIMLHSESLNMFFFQWIPSPEFWHMPERNPNMPYATMLCHPWLT